jgi:hypothetical protein
MNERERWVVYPLLFLALGAALRDKLIDRTTTKSIVCQELIVVDEQPLGREPVLLARIGRQDGDSGDRPTEGELLLNGQFAIVDPGPPGPNQTVKKVVRIGRGKPAKGGSPIGYMWLNGEVVVNGPINAMYYAYQGVPFMPALRKVLPGLPDLLRGAQEAIESSQQPPQQDAPPAESTGPNSSPPTELSPPAESADDDSGEAPSP